MANPKKFGVAIDLSKNELQNAVIQNLASAPSSPVDGQTYYNTTDKHFYVHLNGSWYQMDGQAGNGITQITGDVTAGPGPGSVASTVALVGGVTAANLASAYTARVKKYTATIGNGSLTSITITQATHGCASDRSNTARVSDETSGDQVDCQITYASNGDVTFAFNVAPTTAQYRVVILG